MSLDNSRMASVFVFIALMDMSLIGALAIPQTDQDPIGLEEAPEQIVKIGVI